MSAPATLGLGARKGSESDPKKNGNGNGKRTMRDHLAYLLKRQRMVILGILAGLSILAYVAIQVGISADAVVGLFAAAFAGISSSAGAEAKSENVDEEQDKRIAELEKKVEGLTPPRT